MRLKPETGFSYLIYVAYNHGPVVSQKVHVVKYDDLLVSVYSQFTNSV